MRRPSASGSAQALGRSGLSSCCHFKDISQASAKMFMSGNGKDANSNSIMEVWEFREWLLCEPVRVTWCVARAYGPTAAGHCGSRVV